MNISRKLGLNHIAVPALCLHVFASDDERMSCMDGCLTFVWSTSVKKHAGPASAKDIWMTLVRYICALRTKCFSRQKDCNTDDVTPWYIVVILCYTFDQAKYDDVYSPLCHKQHIIVQSMIFYPILWYRRYLVSGLEQGYFSIYLEWYTPKFLFQEGRYTTRYKLIWKLHCW